MKIKKMIQLLDVIQDKMAFDMYDSFPYTVGDGSTK